MKTLRNTYKLLHQKVLLISNINTVLTQFVSLTLLTMGIVAKQLYRKINMLKI